MSMEMKKGEKILEIIKKQNYKTWGAFKYISVFFHFSLPPPFFLPLRGMSLEMGNQDHQYLAGNDIKLWEQKTRK